MQYRADNHCARVYIEQPINHNDFDTYIIIIVIT